tara:strand:+ start:2769 stop:3374 length:606 start_codon:yes stop_codon:yes gene_type:complete
MSQLKLTADSGGGTVAIKGPASTTSNGAFELTLPGTGNRGLGKILQVVNATTSTMASTSGATYVDTNLEDSITPTASGSKILITVSQQLSLSTSSSGNGGGLAILRKIANGSFSMIEPGPANGTGPFSFFYSSGNSTSSNSHLRHNMTHLDSPSYTLGQQLTYKTQMRMYDTGGSPTLKAQDSAASVNPATSHIILMEVAA